jgi:DNA-binding response OmpR family regulator
MEARIVVIDNDETMRHLFALSLERQGWQVFSYAYVQLDLAALEHDPPDLIMLDFDLDDGGIGWELLQMLKMDDTTATIPILITTTAFQLSAEIRDYLLTRSIGVVTKPFDINTFTVLDQKTLKLASLSSVLFSSDCVLPILVVEDTEDLRDTLATILRLEGYPVLTAYNGLVALDAVSRADYALILLDIAMPVMDGLEFLRAYERQLRPHSPVIILSGELHIPTHNLPAFVVDVLPKPFAISELLRLVEQFRFPV